MSAVTMVKSHENKNFKISSGWQFSQILVKCSQYLSFENMDITASYTGKNDGVWLLWGIFKEYLKQNIITAVLRKANAHSVAICRLIKKSIM